MKLLISALAAIAILSGCQQKEAYKVGDTINLITQEKDVDKLLNEGHVLDCTKIDSSLKKKIGDINISKKDISRLTFTPETSMLGIVLYNESPGIMVTIMSKCKIIK